jgi:large subunit ribosomal protein L29
MKVSELRELSSDDLLQKEKTLKKDIFELNQQRELGAVEKPSRFSLIKKDIARIHIFHSTYNCRGNIGRKRSDKRQLHHRLAPFLVNLFFE